MPAMWMVIVTALLLGVLTLSWRSMQRRHLKLKAIDRHASRLMAGRASLSVDEFADLFPPQLALIAKAVREELTLYSIFDLSRMRPDDRLVWDLGLGRTDGIEPLELLAHLGHKFKVDLSKAEMRELHSTRTLVDYIASLPPRQC